MTITPAAIEAAAPDQASLKAAIGLVGPQKWSNRQSSPEAGLVWGDCQGSGANPYRVAVDLADLGAKCTCPSRKFPCKHALALMIVYERAPADFPPAAVPGWVTDWLGRRRRDAAPRATAEGKNLASAQVEAGPPAEPADPAETARREAARDKRASATRASVSDGLGELEGWVADQLRTGLSATLADLTARCRRIASRLVDAKAATLAARVDTIPARLLALPLQQRGDALIAELGKLVILSRAWNGGETAPEVWREIVAAETREALLANAEALRYAGAWEVLATREEARRDGLIARSTWLLGLDPPGPRFALLLDFLPASTGRHGAAFDPGEQFRGELAFYPASRPLRAQIVTRERLGERRPWPATGAGPALDHYARAVTAQPWLLELPLLLPPGRLASAGKALWWQGAEEALPLAAESVTAAVRGAALSGAAVLWNASRAVLLAAETDLGPYHLAD